MKLALYIHEMSAYQEGCMNTIKLTLAVLLLISFHANASDATAEEVFTADGEVQYWLIEK